MQKKHILIGLIIFIVCSSCQAFLGGDRTDLQNYRLSNIFLKVNEKEHAERIYIYDRLIEKIEESSKLIGSEKTKEIFTETISKIELKKQVLISELPSLSRHKSLILKFGAGAESVGFLESKRAEIENIESVFIFRAGSTNLPGYQIESISSKLLEINPDLFIFIDQEGGLINRYVEFDGAINFKNYLTNNIYIKELYTGFEIGTQTYIDLLFPAGYSYFPSLNRVGELYESVSESDKQSYLDLIAYLRLKTLQDRGINTYGFVMDLDRGNPVIRNFKRSFSSDVGNYKKLGDSFIKASQKTGVSLYLKHFPGHGAGQVDSHAGILDYTNNTAYLRENLELFQYMFDNKGYTQMGVMVGHMYVPNTLKSQFTNVIDDSDYLLTDDLAMQGYVQATGGVRSNVFFTTDVVFDSEKAILVDSLLNPQIK